MGSRSLYYALPVRRHFWSVLGCIMAPLMLGGCAQLAQLPAHAERASRHTGITSSVEQIASTPATYRLRVEGNSIVPTLDVERTFSEEVQKKCDGTPLPFPHLLERKTQIVNTWAGGAYEITGTFRCDASPHPVEPEPQRPADPPSKLRPFEFPIKPAAPEKKKATPSAPRQNKKKPAPKKSKGCNCVRPEDPALKLPFPENKPGNAAPAAPAKPASPPGGAQQPLQQTPRQPNSTPIQADPAARAT